MSTLPQKRRRGPKASIACDTCRRLKGKCDQEMPCGTCAASSEECVYRSNLPTKRKRSHQVPTRKPADLVERRNLPPSPTDQTRVRKYQAELAPIAPAPQRRNSIVSPSSNATPSVDIVNTNSPVRHQKEYGTRIPRPQTLRDDPLDDASSDEETSPQGFGETNHRTNGKEFYGPAATLAFLIELRSRARAFRRRIPTTSFKSQLDKRKSGVSLVNLMDAEDTEIRAHGECKTLTDRNGVSDTPESHSSLLSPAFLTGSSPILTNEAIEKDCIVRYFQNLHVIYYFLDRQSFMKRCEQEIWVDAASALPTDAGSRGSKFPALYNAVVAVGALTSGDDIFDQNSTERQLFWNTLAGRSNTDELRVVKSSNLPRELAKVYFAKAKALLGDCFETCSLESQQTLLLLSIFCQYALKPHCCYMYNGMAARTAMAIGSANLLNPKKNPAEAIRTFWCMYYHEIEVSSLLGRETTLRDPESYPVFLAKFGDPIPQYVATETTDETIFFARSNTELARILRKISEAVYHTGSNVEDKPQINRHQAALDLDSLLLGWRSSLAPVFDLDVASLTEKETVTKRKLILQLRFHSARIMIHRPFLLAAAAQEQAGIFRLNVQTCLDAARQTVQLLYQTFINRPFFRTWWYNTTYAFNAASVILYVLVTGIHEGSANELLFDVEMALKIFQAMDGIRIARRCADLTQEILECAKMALQDEKSGRIPTTYPSRNRGLSQQRQDVANCFVDPALPPTQPLRQPPPAQADTLLTATGLTQWDSNTNFSYPSNDDFFATITDVNILDSFGANLMGFEGNLPLGLDGSGEELGLNMDDVSSYGDMWGFQ